MDSLYEILTNRERLLALQAILKQAIPRRKDGQLDWERAEPIVADYVNIDVPCLILWGEYDETLPLAMGYKLANQIPTAEIHVVPDCKHSMQLEHPVLLAEVIRRYSPADARFSLEEVARQVQAGTRPVATVPELKGAVL